MIALVIAVYAVAVPSVFAAVLFVIRLAVARLGAADFSWGRYVGWVLLTGSFAATLFVFENGVLFALGASFLVFALLFRVAVDSRATSFRDAAGFLQAYAGLSFVESRFLVRGALLDGGRASARLAFELHDVLGHLALPVPSFVAGHAPSWSMPAVVVGSIGSALCDNVLFTGALTTFAILTFAHSYFAERTTLEVGLSLLPAPTVAAVVFAALAVANVVLPIGSAHFVACAVTALLSPFFVFEGLWVVRRFAGGLRLRAVLELALAGLACVVPVVLFALAALGWLSRLVRLRALEPILGSVRRSPSRPRLRTVLGSSLGGGVVLVLLAAADAASLRQASAALGSGPDVCARVTLTPGRAGVSVDTGSSHYVIDQDETAVAVTSADAAARACEKKGERPCTSDEWTLACVCSYPNESEGGPKIFSNTRLAYRVERDHVEAPSSGGAEVLGLLSGKTEFVLPRVPGGGVLVAGPTDAVPDPWTTDCRYRGLLTPDALAAAPGSLVGVRCCL